MSSRQKLTLVFSFFFVVGLGLVSIRALRPVQGGRDWLFVSRPVFSYRTNADRVQSIVCFVVSNASSQNLGFYVPWCEHRTRSDLSLTQANRFRRGSASRAIPLGPGGTTNVVIDVGEERPTDAEPLFCCQVTWV
jgi:hypothetical protein